ncbi:MAG: SMC-Scp complex subunit ScpB [Nitrospirae bacterium]|nr:MAG: SMC-Scp complex subunit ScpB [Nitrospirota bacterium]
MELDQKGKKSLLEALLFISGDPLGAKEIQKITGFSSGEIGYLMTELMAEYRDRGGGLLIREVAEGYQMVTAPEYAPYLRKLKETSPTRLSPASLETLAIVAYRQPITKAEIDELRGVSSDGVLKSLLERRLIRIVGKKEAPGRPLLYGTTKEFLLHFGLKDLSELPTIRELSPDEL